MNKKVNKRILGMTQTELLILITVSGFLLCVIVFWGGYIIYDLNRPIPVATPTTSMPTLFTLTPIQPTNTSTLVPKATARPTFTAIPTATIFVIPPISIPTGTTTATVTATTAATSIVDLSPCENTISEKYLVIFRYPANWGCDVIGNNAFGFSRPEGFIEIMTREASSTAKEFCEKQIQDSHGLNSFGKKPTIQVLQIDNQPACLVLPSNDQQPKYRKASLLVVLYPQSVMDRTLLLLSADKNHIRGFISTMTFVR